MFRLFARRKPEPPDRLLDEASLRRPDFAAYLARAEANGEIPMRDVQVMLSNGQKWWVPKPVRCFKLKGIGANNPGFEMKVYFGNGRRAFGDGYLKILQDPDAFKTPFGTLDVIARASAFLLGQNYDLAADEVVQLLPRLINDETNDLMWDALTVLIGGEEAVEVKADGAKDGVR